MRDNRLWEGHRLILPEMREKAIKHCRDCRFLVRIRGREEVRWGCVAGLPRYGTLERAVPEELHVAEILRAVGKDGLAEVLSRGDPEARACGLFLPRCGKNPGHVQAARRPGSGRGALR